MKIVMLCGRRLIGLTLNVWLGRHGEQPPPDVEEAASGQAGPPAPAMAGDVTHALPNRASSMPPRIGTPARAALVDRAERARAALVRVRESGAEADAGSSAAVQRWHRAQIDAQAYLRAYQAAVGELDRKDRLARRVATEWLEVTLTALWYRVAEADDAEALALDYLYHLPLHSCPRTAAREIALAHQSAIGRWLAEHRDELREGRAVYTRPTQTRKTPGLHPR